MNLEMEPSSDHNNTAPPSSRGEQGPDLFPLPLPVVPLSPRWSEEVWPGPRPACRTAFSHQPSSAVEQQSSQKLTEFHFLVCSCLPTLAHLSRPVSPTRSWVEASSRPFCAKLRRKERVVLLASASVREVSVYSSTEQRAALRTVAERSHAAFAAVA